MRARVPPIKVLVTGGAGFIGSHVVERLAEEGAEVTVLDNFSTGRRRNVDARAKVWRADLRGERLPNLVREIAPEVVVHAAAQASVVRSVAAPLFDASINVLGTVRLVTACAAAGVRAMVYVSTGGAAYGDTARVPTPEDHALQPTSPYGVSKVSAEHYVRCFGALYGMRTITVRLANVYGPRQDPEGEAGVVAIFASRLLHGQPCTIYGDGNQTRDFVYVGDVADAIVKAVRRTDAGGAVNISTGTETSVARLYKSLAAIVGVRRPAVYAAARAGEQRRSALSPNRARRVLGWAPKNSLEAGLARTVEYFRNTVGRSRLRRDSPAHEPGR